MNGRNLITTLLLIGLAVLTYRLWLADNGYQEVRRLKQDIDIQAAEVEDKQRRNRALEADVKDLKEGVDAVEERARTELGMTREGETFVQFLNEEDPPGASKSPKR